MHYLYAQNINDEIQEIFDKCKFGLKMKILYVADIKKTVSLKIKMKSAWVYREKNNLYIDNGNDIF